MHRKLEETLELNETAIVPWKIYLTITAETIIAFYLATFSLAMYITHRSPDWVLTIIILGLLYIFIIGACIKRLLEKLSIAALMLIIPIAPLLALGVVVSLIPLLQLFAN